VVSGIGKQTRKTTSCKQVIKAKRNSPKQNRRLKLRFFRGFAGLLLGVVMFFCRFAWQYFKESVGSTAFILTTGFHLGDDFSSNSFSESNDLAIKNKKGGFHPTTNIYEILIYR
jgi:hypothetical protein